MSTKQFFSKGVLTVILSFVLFSAWAGPKTYSFVISFQSIPGDAKVYYKEKLVSTTTPATISIDLNKKEIAEGVTFKFVKAGYPDGTVKVKPNLGKVGFFKFSQPISVCYEFAPGIDVTDKPEQATAVSRDNAGMSALERTVIRWYFDSEPKGARVFWRVISSVPAEVKNTNELWLGSTPFEETRSFNIEGLTYENARDVQIEIKVRRKGYVEQSKRFNVRQAIDQQEISSFFDLVSENE